MLAFGEKGSWIRCLYCVVRFSGWKDYECYGERQAAHVKSRGAGGDSTHLIPLCTAHHAEQHAVGIKTFAAKYGLDLESLAAEYEARWLLIQEEGESK